MIQTPSPCHQLKGVVYGAAVGDALGVPFEFMERGSFTCIGMAEGGVHRVPLGTFSDDTSLLLATCDSIKACKGINVEDMRTRFCDWLYGGKYAADGRVFDVGNATATSLNEGRGRTHEMSNGNGSLMRIAPIALTDATDKEVRAASAITHAHAVSTEACVLFVHVLREILQGSYRIENIGEHLPDDERFAFLGNLRDMQRNEIKSSGYVLDTLSAALWCLEKTGSYKECVLEAVNLGSDSDTTACVAGALAGAQYGYGAIPEQWIEQLRGKDIIESCLF